MVNGRNRATQSGGGPLTATSHGSGGGERHLALAQVALCSGARAVLKVLDHMIAEGEFRRSAKNPSSATSGGSRGFKADLLERDSSLTIRTLGREDGWIAIT